MWQVLLAMLHRRRGTTLLAGGGFFLAACTLILLTATTQSTVIRANDIISQNWRPTYDLVVLPPQAKPPASKTVPADFMAGYGGGISMQQYQQIKKISGVEVAAPISYLGYVNIPPPDVAFSTERLPGGYYEADWTLTASNGIQTLTERQQRSLYYLPPSCDTIDSLRQRLSSHQALSSALDKQHIQVTDSSCGFNGGGGPQTFTSVNTGPFLLTAIDPNAENQLVHLDQHIANGRMLSEQDTLAPNGSMSVTPVTNIPRYGVPLLLQQRLPGQLKLQVSFKRLTGQDIDLQQVIDRGGASYLTHLPNQQQIVSTEAPTLQNSLPGVLKQGYLPALQWNSRSWQPIDNLGGDNSMTFLSQPSGLTYQSVPAPDGQGGSAYTLIPSTTQHPPALPKSLQGQQNGAPETVPSTQQGPDVAFRDLTPLHVNDSQQAPMYIKANYETNFVGQFTSPSIAAQFGNPLNWLPETSYAAQPAQLQYDAQGKPVAAKDLQPTTNPAGFMLQPPVALTTMAAAQKIMGDKNISVIRVRVAGVGSASEASWCKVAQVAQEIRQQTGLQVFVTLGSSPQPTLVYLPGLHAGQNGSTREIAPIGWVRDSWIYIGAAVLYISQLGSTRLLFLAAILLVCLGYLIVNFSALASAQQREFAVLSALGWRPWQPIRMFLGQVLLLALVGGICGIGVALLLAVLLQMPPLLPVVIWTLPVILLLALLSVIYPLGYIWSVRPAQALRAGAGAQASGRADRERQTRAWSWLSPLLSLALTNLARMRMRALIAMASAFFTALLLIIMLNGLVAFRQSLQGTILGDTVLIQTQLPQIAGVVFALVFTFLSVANLLLLQVRERRQEIGLLQAVGWRPGLVQRMFMQEGLALIVCGSIPGAVVALWILVQQHATQRIVPTPLIALAVLIVMGILGTLATIPAMRQAKRLPITEILRAE
ncbi:hypothetical protein KDH_68630 [Dictyobacter sp. S3.2.2.5]|uniref:ABC3 transporter permease C-terminal domain-containing protein n=1 Tax=Dictyobacter halimunensis TaxID=3026934 RepID=A0ABQ6G0L8_9CHLR|nr:hypothetical protein KDH_68630 [Dictyobacter sp. S3.2.2.5]